MAPDAHSGDVQVVEINVENIVHSYKSGIGNSVHKMLVFSRTRPCEEHYKYRYILQPLKEPEQQNCILTHRDVLGMLALAVAVSTTCAVNILSGWNTAASVNLFLIQMAFCVVAFPTLTLAVALPASVFFGDYIITTHMTLIVQCLFGLLCTETLLLFWLYI